MRVIGIDPGTRWTGYGIIDKKGNQLVRVASGRIKAGTSAVPLPQRLVTIHDELEALLEVHRPSEGAIEGIFFAKNAMSALKLGHARGVAMMVLHRHEVELMEYPPASVKQAVTGNGRAKKETVEQMVRMMLGIRGDLSEDESDALAVAICHCNTIQFHRRLS